MDIEDVTHESQYMHYLTEQKIIANASKSFSGNRPRDRKTPLQCVVEHMMHYINHKNRDELLHSGSDGSGGRITLKTSVMGEPYPPSVKSIDDSLAGKGEKTLKKIMMKELRIGRNKGTYLLVRTIVPAFRMTAIISVVQDEDGDVEALSLYHQEPEHVRCTEDILKNKTVLVLKEPFFKVLGDGGYGIRVDHLTDVVMFKASDARIPSEWAPRLVELNLTAERLWKLGNACVEMGKWRDAIGLYSSALQAKHTPSEAIILRNNRALCNLRLGAYDAALEDVNFITNASERSEKALYRGALALYNLRRFQDSFNLLQILLKEFPDSPGGKFEFSRVQLRLTEQKTGEYDFKKMYKATKLRPPTFDCATFVGPVEIRNAAGHGRGLFTTKSVKAGELLLCEKAFAHCVVEPQCEGREQLSLLVDLSRNRVTMSTHDNLITQVAWKLLRNPSLAAEFLELHHGSYEPVSQTEVDGLPIVDTFLIDRIIALNIFGCPISSKDNLFGKTMHITSSKEENEPESFFSSTGMWLKASYVNHSCLPTCARSFIGDMLILRATADLPADTELTFWYIPPKSSISPVKTQEKLQRGWGFKCDCELCVTEAKTPLKKRKKRELLMKEFLEKKDANGNQMAQGMLAKMEKLSVELEKTYEGEALPKFKMWELHFELAGHWCDAEKPANVLKQGLKTLSCLGWIVKFEEERLEVVKWGIVVKEVVDVWVMLWDACVQLGEREKANRADEYARTAYKIVVGEDQTFAEVYGRKAEKAINMEKIRIGD